ncbi:hypothetical protein AURDEDRAFT_159239 [Auricularia subglabra TFB-10046 SS5]|nr:hypothetical protein AURDEDRAFT_159239 [Auricularia subglabra TFB-10046 SS5]
MTPFVAAASSGNKVMMARSLRRAEGLFADASLHCSCSPITCTLSQDILVIIFALLGLDELFAVSHVSQAWRSAAVSTSSLWAEITSAPHNCRVTPKILELVVSRAGSLPLAIAYRTANDLTHILTPAMHCIRSLEMDNMLSNRLPFLDCAAPLLRSLSIGHPGICITEDFLGNTTGQLTKLHAASLLLPRSCASLSTITELSASSCEGSSFQDIFALCPRLQSLSLEEVPPDVVSSIGTLPVSLIELSLGLELDEDTDAIDRLCAACNAAENLQHVALTLSYDEDTSPRDLMPFMNGATTLTVTSCSHEHATVVSRFAHGPQKTLTVRNTSSFQWEEPAWDGFPPIFHQPASCFANVHTLTLPISALAELPRLPALEELRLRMYRGMPLLDGPARGTGFPWHLVRSLTHIETPRVVLDIEGASPEDVRAMMGVLARTARHLRLSVCGLSPKDVDVPDGLRLTFI